MSKINHNLICKASVQADFSYNIIGPMHMAYFHETASPEARLREMRKALVQAEETVASIKAAIDSYEE